MQPEKLAETAEMLKLLEPYIASGGDVWIPAAAAILGALVGAVGSVLPSIALERRREHRENGQIQSAIVAEISSIIGIVETRGYLNQINQVISHCKNNPEFTTNYVVQVSPSYSEVYQANLPRIGNLDSTLIRDIVKFHKLIESIKLDIQPGGIIATKQCGELEFRSLKNLVEEALKVGKNIVASYA